ncbi:MAG: twin-arginine translocation signal domain-containing protein, partial [Armatimonadota bacterium]
MALRSTRREFLRQAAAAGAGVAAAGVLGQEVAAAAQPGSRSRLVVVRNRSTISKSDSPGGQVNKAVVAQM